MYTRIDLLKDIYEYEKEMRQYEKENKRFLNARQKEIANDTKQETRSDRELHTESV